MGSMFSSPHASICEVSTSEGTRAHTKKDNSLVCGSVHVCFGMGNSNFFDDKCDGGAQQVLLLLQGKEETNEWEGVGIWQASRMLTLQCVAYNLFPESKRLQRVFLMDFCACTKEIETVKCLDRSKNVNKMGTSIGSEREPQGVF